MKYTGWCQNHFNVQGAVTSRQLSRFSCGFSKKDAVPAQKLGQLQPFTAVFPQECMGQLSQF
jgi:hypothetical protein